MYRSQEIIKIFNKVNLPDEISKYILGLERQWLFENSWLQWISFSRIIKEVKCSRFFYEDYNDLFLQEIRDIQGSFITLKENKERVRIIKRSNRNFCHSIRSLRY